MKKQRQGNNLDLGLQERHLAGAFDQSDPVILECSVNTNLIQTKHHHHHHHQPNKEVLSLQYERMGKIGNLSRFKFCQIFCEDYPGRVVASVFKALEALI